MRLLSFVLSTLVFFVVAYMIRRYLDDARVEPSLGRSVVIFVIAIAAAYGFGALIDWIG